MVTKSYKMGENNLKGYYCLPKEYSNPVKKFIEKGLE
jgi:hypothetical protein